MAKLVSEKRDSVVVTPTQKVDTESASPMASIVGLVLTALFLVGAVAMAFISFRS